jgi:hypothetical protein
MSRKSRMPVAVALKNAFSFGLAFRTLPSGRPRKIVNPAIAPRAST